MSKKRLDVYLFESGSAESREKARALIMAGAVFVDGVPGKPSMQVDEENEINIRTSLKYVSRGGLKLEKAIDVFSLDLKGAVAADIGASTGGFTDCMLQNGAARVFAVDVGYGQLAWKLRNDERVTVMERTNARNLKPEDFGVKLDFASIDVSFISLKHIFPVLTQCLKEDGAVVALIKPQFEAGRTLVGKKGVVKDAAVHEQVINTVFGYADYNGLYAAALDFSPVRGPEGNIEFLALFKKECRYDMPDAQEVVAAAHKTLL
ncbi:MAG: TlyA family RNA methyltransferase [Christensenellales bacterium]|jgi:23S rRNA (cytidine1920-2'-O)/16S rRNA (cytidine1409-2'-O)-methyltransferase